MTQGALAQDIRPLLQSCNTAICIAISTGVIRRNGAEIIVRVKASAARANVPVNKGDVEQPRAEQPKAEVESPNAEQHKAEAEKPKKQQGKAEG